MTDAPERSMRRRTAAHFIPIAYPIPVITAVAIIPPSTIETMATVIRRADARVVVEREVREDRVRKSSCCCFVVDHENSGSGVSARSTLTEIRAVGWPVPGR